MRVESEVALGADPSALAWDRRLFVGTEDGCIKSYSEKLFPGAAWAAHDAPVFALAAGGGRVYSASNDGGIRVFSQEGAKLGVLPPTGADVGALQARGDSLYSGDEAGTVVLYENLSEKARYNMLEEVKGLAASPPLLFTARDLDLTVTQITPDESRTRFLTKHTMEGRAPLQLCGPAGGDAEGEGRARGWLLLMARGGTTLRLHDTTIDTRFKLLDEVKASDMIVTSLAASGDTAWSGGWDGTVRRWRLAGGRLQPAGELAVGGCVAALLAPAPDRLYVAVAGGKLLVVTDS